MLFGDHDAGGVEKICLPLRVARIFSGGMGQGAMDLGRRTRLVRRFFLAFIGADKLQRSFASLRMTSWPMTRFVWRVSSTLA